MAIRPSGRSIVRPPARPRWQSRYHGARMTPEEFLALPEEKPYLEYVDGVVLQKPMPNEEHAELAFKIGFYIQLWMAGARGRIGVEARARLGQLPNYRLPDVSFWRAGIPRGEEAPPTLAIEIRSKDQTLAELRRKCEFLRDSGVEACWLVDPFSRSAELFEGNAKHGRLVTKLTAECLPGFELLVSELFAALDAQAE